MTVQEIGSVVRMHRYLIVLMLLGLVPWVLGKPWTQMFRKSESDAFAYGVGFFLELTIYQVVAFPLIRLHVNFNVISLIFSSILLVCCFISLLFLRKNHLYFEWKKILLVKKFSLYEWILLLAVITVIGVQVVRGISYDLTYMSYDDATYTAIAADALDSNMAGTSIPETGEVAVLDMRRCIQTSLFFPAYLTLVSSISLLTMEHTIQYIQLLLLAYTIYAYMSEDLFQTRINRLAFMLIVSAFYFFGYHSHYSLTFRLLGPNYQGKAVLAVSLTPLILTILIHVLKESYQWKYGVLLLLLSMAAVSLTLWGTGTIAVIVIIPVILSLFRKERNWKHLLYVLWGCVAPAGFTILYLLYRFVV